MLNLPSVTLMGIDTVAPHRTIDAMRHSSYQCTFGDVILLTDTKQHDLTSISLVYPECRIVHAPQDNKKLRYPLKVVKGSGDAPKFGTVIPSYEFAVLIEPSNHVKTDFVIFQEWDAGIIDPDAWKDEFMNYDYIGAPWPVNRYVGCTSRNNVGAGGFAMKSKRWCEIVGALARQQPRHIPLVSDQWACQTMRRELEQRGIRFAPTALADQFAIENGYYAGQFGFHGKCTINMNKHLFVQLWVPAAM